MFEARKKKAIAERQLVLNYKKVFGSPEGREVFLDLFNTFHMMNSHGGDPFMEGQRSVVCHIVGRRGMNPADFDKIIQGESA